MWQNLPYIMKDLGGESTNANVTLVLALVLTPLIALIFVATGVIVGVVVFVRGRNRRNWRVRVTRVCRMIVIAGLSHYRFSFAVQVDVFMPTSHSKPEYPENEKTASQEQIQTTGVQADTSSQEDFVSADSKPPKQVSESDKSPLTPTKAEKESKYTLVETPFSGVQPTLPIDSRVQYQEVHIRATYVS